MRSQSIHCLHLFFFPDEHDEKADGQQCAGDPDAPFGHVRRQQRPQSRAYGKQADDAAKEALLQKKSMQEHRNAEAQLARAISRLRTKEHWNSRR